jgi:hypothetical protein
VWRFALPLMRRGRERNALAARAHRQRATRGALGAWRVAVAVARRRAAARLVWRLRTFPARAGPALRGWAAVARAAALLRDEYGAADACAREGRLARALARWHIAAAARGARMDALRPALAQWRAAAERAAAAPRAYYYLACLRRCMHAWTALARDGGGDGTRRARAAAALAALKGACVGGAGGRAPSLSRMPRAPHSHRGGDAAKNIHLNPCRGVAGGGSLFKGQLPRGAAMRTHQQPAAHSGGTELRWG